MNPLRIQCETCQAELQVRDPGFVGEVHACPRCGSMVLIASATAGPTETPPGDNPAAEKPTAAATLLLSDTLVESLDAGDEPPPPDSTPEAEATGPDPAPDPAFAKGVAPSSAPMLITLVALSGVAALGGAWLLSDRSEPVAETKVSQADNQPVVSPATQPADETPVAVDQTIDLARAEVEPAEQEPIESLPEQSTDAEPPVDDRIARREPIAPTPQPEPAMAEEPELPSTPIDPLDFDPDTIDLVLRGEGAAPPDPEAAPEPMGPSPPPLIAEDPALRDLDNRLRRAGMQNGVEVRRGPTGDPDTGPPYGSADERLERRLPRIDLSGVPLVEAAELLGSLIGSPLSIEPSALTMAGIEATHRVPITGEGLPLSELLAQTLAKSRLGYRTEGAHVIVERPGADRFDEVGHKLTDLRGEDAERFDSLLATLMPPGARVADDQPDDQELAIAATRREHYELLLACERLRAARGAPLASRYPRRLLRTTPALGDMAGVLERRTTMTFIRLTPVTEVLAHLQRVTGVAIVVDWRSLGDAGLGPRTPLVLSVANRPVAEALDGVLGELGLGWAALDGKTLWITSLERLAGETWVDLYPTTLAVGERIAQRLTSRHPESRAHYDRQAKSLIVRGDSATHRAVWRSVASGGSEED